MSLASPLALAIAAVLSVIGAAQTQDLCAKVDTLVEQSQSGFVAITEEARADEGDHAVTLSLAGATDCRVTRKSTRSWYHCAWEFPHRAEGAYSAFDELAAKLDACIGSRSTLHSDRSVNHPDFYDSRLYEMARADVSVSVKDKSALGKTFVFIRVQGRGWN